MLKYDQFVNESSKSVNDLILEKVFQIIVNDSFTKRRQCIRLNHINEDLSQTWEVFTYKEPFDLNILEVKNSKMYELEIKDRYNKVVTDESMLKYLLHCLEKYLKFLKNCAPHALTNKIAGALSGDIKAERQLFDSLQLYKIKWDDFSQELLDSLTDSEKVWLKSINILNKYSI